MFVGVAVFVKNRGGFGVGVLLELADERLDVLDGDGSVSGMDKPRL